MNFQDNFSKQAELYAKSRPHYPKELFQYLSTLTAEHKLAWDCATGNGQAAIALTDYYKKVIGTDASESQIKNAKPHDQVEYRVALAEDSMLSEKSVDLITVATALHWFDLEKFYAEVKRVGKPGGILAAWAYFKLEMDDRVQLVLRKLSIDFLGKYWSPDLKKVAGDYKTIPFPFEEIEAPHFDAITSWNIQNLIDYIHTWSFTQKYIDVNGKDPVDEVISELRDAWGDININKEIKWPLALKIGRL